MPEMEKKDLETDGQAEEIIEDIPSARPDVKKAETGSEQKKAGARVQEKKAPSAGKQTEGKKAEKRQSAGEGIDKGVSEDEALPADENDKQAGNAAFRLLDDLSNRLKQRSEKQPLSEKAELRRRKRRKKLIWKLIRRTILCLMTAAALAAFGGYMALFTVFNGPSQTIADQTVIGLLESSALQFVPGLFYSEEELQQIILRSAEETLISAEDIPPVEAKQTAAPMVSEQEPEQQEIELASVAGATYRGYMMIVKDPSRVKLAVCDPEFDSGSGKLLGEMAAEEGAIAAINAGGLKDSGRKPLGVVIRDGETLNSRTDSSFSIVVGFDQADQLVVGKMSAKEAAEKGLRDAAASDMILVLDGEAEKIKESGELRPRTAIGQREDGTVLLLVIDGWQANSLGADMNDLAEVMMRFGAENAANLSGGSYSRMYYQGTYVNDGTASNDTRKLPTAFVVK